jgi:hypothetical protein
MNSANEKQKPMKPKTETTAVTAGQEAVGGGKRWSGMWVNLGKGGQEVGKWTGFSRLEPALTRLFPHKSTQVVDFPRMVMVSIFSECHEIGFSGQAELGTNIGEAEII